LKPLPFTFCFENSSSVINLTEEFINNNETLECKCRLPYNPVQSKLEFLLKWEDLRDSWGQSLDGPAYGAIAIFNRSSHIGFVVGRNGNNLIIIHGNWSDRIDVSNYIKPSEIQYYRYPNGYTPCTLNK
jgi:hypothetical protein